ncbi:MAG: hypothetical protein MN733_20780 [Nitrososphaera sp.]|nr:hypothetical protein [Nitrososphaera sp.]
MQAAPHTIITGHGEIPQDQAVDYLTYACYKHNRMQYPNTTPEQWRTVFGKRTDALESRFQQEQGSTCSFVIVTEGFSCRAPVAAEVDGILITTSVR